MGIRGGDCAFQRVRSGAGRLVAIGAVAATFLAGGCQKKVWTLVLKTTPEQRLMRALGSTDADVQRKALNQLARSKPVKEGRRSFVTSLDVIARTDPNPQVRCAALRALSASPNGEQLLATALKVINDRDARVRRDACEMIVHLLEGGDVPEGQRAEVQKVLLGRLLSEDSPDVRIVACRGLGHLQSREVLRALITVVDERNFTVAYHAERALIRLTGHTCDCDAAAWKRWLEETQDPFARAGQEPESRLRKRGSLVQRMGAAAKRVLPPW